MTSQTGRNKGFTLIELALVALIILILVGVSTPSFRRTFYDIQLNEAGYNIVKFMNYARAKSISERVETKLNFDFEAKKYWLTAKTNPERPDDFAHIKGRLGRFHSVPREVEIKGDSPSLVFYPNGRSDDFKLYLLNKKNRMKLIEVKSETGQADLLEYKE